eukprot:SAG11_NODE_1920_length_4069_cov_3.001511_2_plen_78_part_00
MAGVIRRLLPETSLFFLCDIQEVFRSKIFRMEHVIFSAQLLTQTASILEVPVIVTEQYPSRLVCLLPSRNKHATTTR